MWYAHKVYHGVLAQDITLHHAGPGIVTVAFAQPPLPPTHVDFPPFRGAVTEAAPGQMGKKGISKAYFHRAIKGREWQWNWHY